MDSKTKNAKNESWGTETKDSVKIFSDQGQIDEVIGYFGKYQMMIFMFKILIGVTSAFNNLGVTFSAPSDFVGHRCSDRNTNIATTNISSETTSLFYDFLHGQGRAIKHGDNFRFETPKNIQRDCYPTYNNNHSANQQERCQSYEYDTGIWLSTIIDEWDLVCHRAWLVSMTQSLYMSGFIVSFLLFGYLSDRFGRWKSCLGGALIEILSGLGCAFSTSITMYMIFRFTLGVGNAGRTSSSYLIMIEWTGPKWRMYISTLGSLGWTLGYCSMPWISSYFLHFRHMQLFVCLYETIFVIWLLSLPESPRWLLTHKRFDEAYEVLLSAARFNGLIIENKKKNGFSKDAYNINSTSQITCAPNITDSRDHMITQSLSLNNLSKQHLPSDVKPNDVEIKLGSSEDSTSTFDDRASSTDQEGTTENNDASQLIQTKYKPIQPYTLEDYDIKFRRLVNYMQDKEFSENEHKLSIVDLFKWKNLRKYALILFFIWAANSFIYYGIALRVGDFGGSNLFVAFTIAGITELPSILFTILCMSFLPRRTANLFIFTTVGMLCAVQAPFKYYDLQSLQQVTIMLAKLFNSCSFNCILYQTMELFPTSIRQTAYSSCALSGRIGSILAPFIKELAQVTNRMVPPIIYAFLSFLSALFVIFLPETKESDLPDTLLEAEKFDGSQANSNKSRKQQMDFSHSLKNDDKQQDSLKRRKSVNGDARLSSD